LEIAKAEESLKAAELCYAQGCYNSSANRAYYAMFVRRESAVQECRKTLDVQASSEPLELSSADHFAV
jgi:hypothetical protein